MEFGDRARRQVPRILSLRTYSDAAAVPLQVLACAFAVKFVRHWNSSWYLFPASCSATAPEQRQSRLLVAYMYSLDNLVVSLHTVTVAVLQLTQLFPPAVDTGFLNRDQSATTY